MPELETFLTGGIVSAVIAGAAWVVSLFRGMAKDGEEFAEGRIAKLTVEFEAHRTRSETAIARMGTELDAVTRELAEARTQLRACRQESHVLQMSFDNVATRLAALEGGGG